MNQCLVVNTTNEPKTLSYRSGSSDDITLQPRQHLVVDARYAKKLPEGVVLSQVEVRNSVSQTAKSKPSQNK